MKIIYLSLLISLLFFLTPNAYAEETKVAAPDIQKVIFTELKDMDKAIKEYPFLETSIRFIQDYDKSAATTSNFGIAKISDMIFLRVNGSSFCGTLGCKLEGYAVDDKGVYQQKLTLSIADPIYTLKKDNKTSLLFCANNGMTEWESVGNSFDFKGPFKTDPMPDCSAP